LGWGFGDGEWEWAPSCDPGTWPATGRLSFWPAQLESGLSAALTINYKHYEP